MRQSALLLVALTASSGFAITFGEKNLKGARFCVDTKYTVQTSTNKNNLRAPLMRALQDQMTRAGMPYELGDCNTFPGTYMVKVSLDWASDDKSFSATVLLYDLMDDRYPDLTAVYQTGSYGTADRDDTLIRFVKQDIVDFISAWKRNR